MEKQTSKLKREAFFLSFLNGAISAINISVLRMVEVELIMGLLTLSLIYWKARQMSNPEQYMSHNLNPTLRTLQ